MVQNISEPKRRGRPRAYDPELALARATEAFWRSGYSGASLDDLAAATGMNRPSLYAAFGDKHATYLKALQAYWTMGGQVMAEALSPNRSLAEGLMRVYRKALAIYFPEGAQPRGCFAIGTATSEACEDPQIRENLLAGLHGLDQGLEKRIRQAIEEGELPANSDAEALAMLASAILHTLAIRSRAGEGRTELERLARKAVGVICRGA